MSAAEWSAEEVDLQRRNMAGETVVVNRRRHRRLVTWARTRGVLVDVSRKGPWGNPWTTEEFPREEAVAYHRAWLPMAGLDPSVLRGKVLSCWCAPEACHAETLAEVADQGWRYTHVDPDARHLAALDAVGRRRPDDRTWALLWSVVRLARVPDAQGRDVHVRQAPAETLAALEAQYRTSGPVGVWLALRALAPIREAVGPDVDLDVVLAGMARSVVALRAVVPIGEAVDLADVLAGMRRSVDVLAEEVDR